MIQNAEARTLVREVLQRLLEDESDVVGYGEYGKGWNDRGESIRQKFEEEMKKWVE